MPPYFYFSLREPYFQKELHHCHYKTFRQNYFLTNHQNRKLKLFKTTMSQRTIILLSLFNLNLFYFTYHQNKPPKCQSNNISSHYLFTFSIYICSISLFINVCKYFQYNVLNVKVKSKTCINFIFYFVKLLIRQKFFP